MMDGLGNVMIGGWTREHYDGWTREHYDGWMD